MGELPVERWVYYCVDDFSQWPGLDQTTLLEMERSLIAKADVLIAASENLKQRLEGYGRRVKLLNHGVDLEHWQADGRENTLASLEEFERPLIVFWGLIDERMDVEFVDRLSSDLEQGTILLVGPQSSPDPALQRISRVRLHAPVRYEELPCVGRAADVLMMPYADLPVTRAMQPLKLLEYLATGRPVVVRDLPATRPWSDVVGIAQTADQFSALVRARLGENKVELPFAPPQRLLDESWSSKAAAFECTLFQ